MAVTPLTTEQQRLMEENLHLAEKCASQIFRGWGGAPPEQKTHTLEELISWGYIGLARAVARYVPARGPFGNFAYPHIKGAIQDGLRADSVYSRRDRQRLVAEQKINRQLASGETIEIDPRKDSLMKRAVPAQQAQGYDLDALADTSPGLETLVDQHQKLEQLAELADDLSSTNEREIFKLRFFDHREFESIANILKLSRGCISKRHSAAVDKVIAAALERNLGG